MQRELQNSPLEFHLCKLANNYSFAIAIAIARSNTIARAQRTHTTKTNLIRSIRIVNRKVRQCIMNILAKIFFEREKKLTPVYKCLGSMCTTLWERKQMQPNSKTGMERKKKFKRKKNKRRREKTNGNERTIWVRRKMTFSLLHELTCA